MKENFQKLEYYDINYKDVVKKLRMNFEKISLILTDFEEDIE